MDDAGDEDAEAACGEMLSAIAGMSPHRVVVTQPLGDYLSGVLRLLEWHEKRIRSGSARAGAQRSAVDALTLRVEDVSPRVQRLEEEVEASARRERDAEGRLAEAQRECARLAAIVDGQSTRLASSEREQAEKAREHAAAADRELTRLAARVAALESEGGELTAKVSSVERGGRDVAARLAAVEQTAGAVDENSRRLAGRVTAAEREAGGVAERLSEVEQLVASRSAASARERDDLELRLTARIDDVAAELTRLPDAVTAVAARLDGAEAVLSSSGGITAGRLDSLQGLVREVSDGLAELRGQVFGAHAAMGGRLSEAEVAAAALRKMLRMQRGQAGAVFSGGRALLARYFALLGAFRSSVQQRRRLTRAIRTLASTSDTTLRRVYHRTCVAWVRARNEAGAALQHRKRNQRQLEVLLCTSDSGLRRCYLRKAREWVAGRAASPGAQDRKARMERILRSVMSTSADGVRRVYHHKAVQWTSRVQAEKAKRLLLDRRRRAVRVLLGASADGLRRDYLRKASLWVRGRDDAVRKRRAQRLLEVLCGQSAAGTRRVYHRRCVGWVQARMRRQARQRAVEAMLGGSAMGLRRCYHRKAVAFVEAVSKKPAPAAAATSLIGSKVHALTQRLTGASARPLCYCILFAVLSRDKQVRADPLLRRAAAFALAVVNADEVRHACMGRFSAMLRRRRERRLQRRCAQELAGRSGKLAARQAFDRLRNHAQALDRQRDRDMLRYLTVFFKGHSYEEVVKKVDSLGTQVDASLKTLANTNQVLHKLVERLISVDKQIDHLDKVKVARDELSAGPARLPDPPPAVPPPRVADPNTYTAMPAPSRHTPPANFRSAVSPGSRPPVLPPAPAVDDAARQVSPSRPRRHTDFVLPQPSQTALEWVESAAEAERRRQQLHPSVDATLHRVRMRGRAEHPDIPIRDLPAAWVAG
eukprot:TRINITY_DN4117_c1_g1_i1.p1 TRINITY_DN4117_c1_g1~~TRINITY_DN4117_c1_g1_i1.p1  ORF type:complete len:965 (+),score=332.14 TRINITY_DN4117_c1_g1_i1:91-2895(+)